MHDRPTHVTDEHVLECIRSNWEPDADAVAHLAIGFGAHHWRVGGLFVTLDDLGHRHTPESLEATYAGAATLAAQGLEFVLAPLRSVAGTLCVPLAGRAATPWTTGPHGERVRALIRDHLSQVARWTADYHGLAGRTDPRTWVNTHGEPHERNLLAGPHGPLLVDWETLLLAPPERDLRQAGHPGDSDMLRMFDLEWRLDEIAQYAAWFEQPHPDGEDARTSLGGLRHELTRP